MATRKKAAGATPPDPPSSKPSQSDPDKKPFTPEVLDRSVIAKPLADKFGAEEQARQQDPNAPRQTYHVIIDLHLEHPGGKYGRP